MAQALIRLGRAQGFLDREHGGHESVRKIGHQLYDLGGHDAMLVVHAEVANWLPHEGRALEMAWDGIGDWRG